VTGPVLAVEPYLEQASVVLAPVRSGGGMRVKVLQAMAMARPVVTTPLGAEGLAGDRSQKPIAVAESAEGIASATAELLASREAREALGRRARAFVAEHHSWSAYLRRLEAIYAELQSPACATTARGLR
jgi:glycosyltransferase involved in cell wall biosynthesis